LPFLPRPSTSSYTRDLRNKVERHTSVRKSGEDEPDLAEETYHTINEVINQKT
jgi:gas vesicle protein